MATGDTTMFSATVRDAKGRVLTGRVVEWTTSETTIATVSSTGMVTALSAGVASVVATSEGKSGGATLTVTAPAPPPASCPVVGDWNARPQSALGKPGYLQSVTDPAFGSTISRITGDPGTPIQGVSGTWPTTAYHNYAKDQPWSADQRLIVLKQMNGTGFALFLDGTTYQPLFSRAGPPGGGEWRMHPTLPDIAVNLTSSGEVRHWNVRTNMSTLRVAAVSGYTSNEMGPSEGNLSYDGSMVVANAVRSSDGHVVARIINIDAGTTGPVIDLTAASVSELDWVSISALGRYVVAYGTIGGGSQRSKVWDATTGALVGYWQDYTFGHYDLGVDPSGNEVAFGAVGQSPYSHHFIARRLSDGSIIDLTPTGVTSYNWHVSTRATKRLGWGYAATNDRTGYPLDGDIYAIKLDGSKQVERWADHRAENVSYESAPFPVPSPDGRRVLFASTWGSASGPIQTYVAGCAP